MRLYKGPHTTFNLTNLIVGYRFALQFFYNAGLHNNSCCQDRRPCVMKK